ncbi:MAG: amidohydrolase family protein [Planctomycetota bacterium]
MTDQTGVTNGTRRSPVQGVLRMSVWVLLLSAAVVPLCSAGMGWGGNPGAALRGGATVGKIALRAKKIYTGTDKVIEDGIILISDGAIESVGSRIAIPEGYELVDRSSSVVMPGMVDVSTSLSAHGDLSEPTDAVTPLAHASTSFNPAHPDIARAREAGITTALILPSPANVVGGRAAIVKTGGPQGLPQLVQVAGPLTLSVSRSALESDRLPTSPIGLHDLLRRLFAEARADKTSPLSGVASGQEVALVAAWSEEELEGLLELVMSEGIHAVALGAIEAHDLGAELAKAGIPVVLGPFNLRSSERFLRLPAQLGAAGVSVAFTSAAPAGHPEVLRLTAALAVSCGLDPAKALAAITRVPAEIVGLEKRLGTIGPGKDADLVVLSGEPLDLRARVEDVFVDGVAVYHGTAKRAPWESFEDGGVKTEEQE